MSGAVTIQPVCEQLELMFTPADLWFLHPQSTLDDATDDWGIKVERVEIKDVKLPLQLQRAMAAEAEASREARAKVRCSASSRLSLKEQSVRDLTKCEIQDVLHCGV